MAVLDHAVHEKVRIDAAKPYGCANVSRAEGYYAPDRRYFPDGRFEIINVWIENRMSKECRYDMSLTDPRCANCAKRGSGEAYDALIRAKGA